MQGHLLRSASINAGQTLTYIDIQTLQNGLFIIRLKQGEKIIRQKLNIHR
jgi:hypothetical protein